MIKCFIYPLSSLLLFSTSLAHATHTYHGVGFDEQSYELIQNDHLQEAAWIADESGNTAGATLLVNEITHTLEHGSFSLETIQGNNGKPRYFLTFNNGLKGEFIPEPPGGIGPNCPNCEVAAYKFDRFFQLNIIPVRIKRSISLEPGQPSISGSVQYVPKGNLHEGGGKDTDSYKRMVFLDYVSGNVSRNHPKPGNWIYSTSLRRVIANSNGGAFRGFDYACEENQGDKFHALFMIERPDPYGPWLKGENLLPVLRELDPDLKHHINTTRLGRLELDFDFLSELTHSIYKARKIFQRFVNVQLLLQGKQDKEDRFTHNCSVFYVR
jgi:hypothetical protein